MRSNLILLLPALMLAGALSVRADSPDRGVAKFASGSGNILYLATAVGLPLVTDGSHGRNHALRAIDGTLVTVGVTEALKAVTREKRPDSDSHDSFPSGHASAAFAAATLESAYHPRQAWLWYTGATVIGWSRLRLNRHHPQDVVAGAALGYGVARWELGRAHGLIVPGIDRDEPGVTIVASRSF